eukprot:13900241-Ditylum_brightwellii.AAC.1
MASPVPPSWMSPIHHNMPWRLNGNGLPFMLGQTIHGKPSSHCVSTRSSLPLPPLDPAPQRGQGKGILQCLLYGPHIGTYHLALLSE